MATEPKVLLLDEPAAGMNPQEKKDLAHTIRRLRDEFAMTILLIEHDMGLVMDICEADPRSSTTARSSPSGAPAEIQKNPQSHRGLSGRSCDRGHLIRQPSPSLV